jgi:hypothetical protein
VDCKSFEQSTKTNKPIPGCHVATHDWATWQPVIGPRGTQSFANKTATCRHPIGPRAAMSSLPRHFPYVQSTMPRHLHVEICTVQSSPRHLLTSSMPRVTLPVVTRVTSGLVQLRAKMPNQPDTCRLLVLPRVVIRGCHVLQYESTTSAIRTCHVSSYGLTCVLYGLYGQVQSASKNFPCLAWRTECDIFSIRTPFDKNIIPLESGRRARRNGVGFVGFRALSFLSIFQALTGF